MCMDREEVTGKGRTLREVAAQAGSKHTTLRSQQYRHWDSADLIDHVERQFARLLDATKCLRSVDTEIRAILQRKKE